MIRLFSNRWVHFFILSGAAFLLTYLSFSDARWRQEIQFFVFDTFNEIHPREKTDDVIIVDIDDESLSTIGQWPWPRNVVATWVDSLTEMGAKAIVFDGVFAEEDRSSPRFILKSLPDDKDFSIVREKIAKLDDHDMLLAASIKKSKVFVSGFTYSTYTQSPQTPAIIKPFAIFPRERKVFLENAIVFPKAATFLPELEKVSAGNGSFMSVPEFDGVLRRAGMIFTDKENLYPSLALEALRVVYGADIGTKIIVNSDFNPNTIDTKYRIIINEKYKIPVAKDGKLWVYYRKFNKQDGDLLSAYKTISNKDEETRNRIENKIVLIGSSTEGLKDLRHTAIEAFQPGVEIHANIIEQILQNKFLLRPDITLYVEANFIFFVSVILIMLAPFVHVLILALMSGSLMSLSIFGASMSYEKYGLLIDPVYPSLCIFLIFVASTILTYLRTEYERGQIRDAFGLYISPEYMKELTENPEKLKLGGDSRELTVMFTDIRNFTSISEGLTPQELIQLMNDFLTPMSDLVMQTKGTIDKYMGDAMMAFWNAPLDDADHAKHACLAALGMQAELEPINERVRAKAEELGRHPILLKAGIGINTGECAVGNMGSKQRFAYSTLGDAVNVASRLEGQTKAYGVDILMGEKTWELVPDMACLEVDIIKVKGKTKPEKTFALIGDASVKESAEFKKLLSAHNAMIKGYQSGDFKEAQNELISCIKLDKFNLKPLYDLYQTRIETLIKEPPSKDWDGIYTAETK
ncbi:adenylate/guanylate cyclase domain-containing protein [Alphaproteobacteria bacterium]|nr:adenylate/guanylate cyclase domain-containing protein [Alphaproteobacteria bacterium]